MSTETPAPSPKGKVTGKIGAFFQKKYLGVKGLYWVGIFILAIAIYAWKMRDTASEAAAADDTAVAGDATPTVDDAAGDASYQEAYPTIAQGTVTVTQPVKPELANQSITSNTEWVTKGTAYLLTKGIPGTASINALNLYLSGGQLSITQRRYVDMVLAEYGAPPYTDEVSQNQPQARNLIRYVRQAGQQGVYAHYDDSTIWLLTAEQWAAIPAAQRKFVELPPGDPVWSYPRYRSNGTRIN